jgi:hypothetical protein
VAPRKEIELALEESYSCISHLNKSIQRLLYNWSWQKNERSEANMRTFRKTVGHDSVGWSKIVIAAVVSAVSNCASISGGEAAEYLYHPHSPLALGAGFDPIAIDDTKSECIQHKGIRPPNSTGAIGTTFEVAIVRSHQELLEKTQRDTSISASYTFFSTGYSESSFNQYSFSKNSLTWVLRGYSSYGTFELIDPTLKPDYAALDDKSLVRRCGREIITKEVRGAQVALIYHLDDLSESTVSKLERSFQGGASVGGLSADVKSRYQQFLAKASSASRLSMNIDAIGGPGVQALSGLVTAADDVSRVESVVSTYISRITPDSAPGLRFFSASTLSALAGRRDAESEHRARQILAQLYVAETNVLSKLARVQRALDPNEIYLRELDSKTVERLSAAEKQLKASDQDIRGTAEKCAKEQECASTNIDVSKIDVSFLPRSPDVKWQQSGGEEREITLSPADTVSEIYLRPSWTTGIPGIGDEPTFTRKIWSSDSQSEEAILAAGGLKWSRSDSPPEPSGFLYETDQNRSKVVASGSTISVSIKNGDGPAYLYLRGQAPPVTHAPQLIVNDRFGRTFTLDFGSPKCPELERCSMEDLQ